MYMQAWQSNRLLPLPKINNNNRNEKEGENDQNEEVDMVTSVFGLSSVGGNRAAATDGGSSGNPNDKDKDKTKGQSASQIEAQLQVRIVRLEELGNRRYYSIL